MGRRPFNGAVSQQKAQSTHQQTGTLRASPAPTQGWALGCPWHLEKSLTFSQGQNRSPSWGGRQPWAAGARQGGREERWPRLEGVKQQGSSPERAQLHRFTLAADLVHSTQLKLQRKSRGRM